MYFVLELPSVRFFVCLCAVVCRVFFICTPHLDFFFCIIVVLVTPEHKLWRSLSSFSRIFMFPHFPLLQVNCSRWILIRVCDRYSILRFMCDCLYKVLARLISSIMIFVFYETSYSFVSGILSYASFKFTKSTRSSLE